MPATTYTPTKRNIAHATAKAFRASLAEAIYNGVDAMADITAVAASLTTDLTGANNDLVFTARTQGISGNTISVTYVDPEAETATESVEVTGNDIVVTLRSVATVLSTATQVKTAIEANEDADALVSVANAAGNNGSGAVTALAQTYLTRGVDDKRVGDILGEAAGLSFGEVTRIVHASVVDLEDAAHVVAALDIDGFTAYRTTVLAAIDAMAPEGWTP